MEMPLKKSLITFAAVLLAAAGIPPLLKRHRNRATNPV